VVAGAIAVQGRARQAAPAAPAAPHVIVNTRAAAGAVSPLLFGLGVDVLSPTYSKPADSSCTAFAGQITGIGLVRIGAFIADDYDWRTDRFYRFNAAGHPESIPATQNCFNGPRYGAGASVLRVLDRVRQLGATAVVVLNGESDDPQNAAGLVRLIVRRYGPTFARGIYWEIGNAPATWQHFGVPLAERQTNDNAACLPDQYAALVRSYAPALAAALDAPPRIVADEWIANATDQSWIGTVTAVDTQYHAFTNGPPADPGELAGGVVPAPGHAAIGSLDQRLDNLRSSLSQYGSGSAPQIFVGTWNIDDNLQNQEDPLYGSEAQATFVADLLLHLMQRQVAMAAWAQPLYTTTQAPFTQVGAPRPGFRAFMLLRALAGGRLLSLHVPLPPGIDAVAVRFADGHLAVALVNRGRRDGTLRLTLNGLSAAATATIRSLLPSTGGIAVTTRPLAAGGLDLRVPHFGVMVIGVSPR
jgi:hypothetical protein